MNVQSKVLSLTHAQSLKLHQHVLKLKRQPEQKRYLILSKHWQSFSEALFEKPAHIQLSKLELDVLFSRLHNYRSFGKGRGLILDHQVYPGKTRPVKITQIKHWDFVMEPGMSQAHRS